MEKEKELCIRGERIVELYERQGYNQETFADFLGISTSSLRRIENDPNQFVRSDHLIMMAKKFGVSTDYLLALTPLERSNHNVEHLHLTTAACEKLISGEVDGSTLSRLVEHKRFGALMKDTAAYFDDSKAAAIGIQSEVAAFGASIMRQHAAETQNPSRTLAAADGISSQVDAQEIQLEDLSALHTSILKDVKAQLDLEKSSPALAKKRTPATAVSVERIAQIIAEARAKTELDRNEQINYSADKIVDEISEKTGLKGTSLKLLKPVFRFVFRQVGKEKDNK